MSVMTNFNSTPNFLSGASERELLTLSMSEIIDALLADYKSFSHGNDAGIHVPDKKQEPRQTHSCILYAEGLRLARTHLRLAKKLILASLFESNEPAAQWLAVNGNVNVDASAFADIFGCNARIAEWLAANGEIESLKTILYSIAEAEARKEAARKEAEKK